VQMVQVVK